MSMIILLSAMMLIVAILCALFTSKKYRIQYEEPKYQMLHTEDRYRSKTNS